MAGIAIKALAVAALVCLFFDRNHALDLQQELGQQGMELIKGKMGDFMKSLASPNAQAPGPNQQAINQGIGQGIGQVIGQQGLDAAKQKMNEFMNNFKPQSAQQQPSPPPPQPQPAPTSGQQGIAGGVGQGISQVIGQQGMAVAKEKYNEFLNSIKQSASESLSKAQGAIREPDVTKKAEQQVSSFFTGALSKLKNAFGSGKTTNPDDSTKQQAVKAFDEYAEKNSNGKPQLR